MRTVKLLIAFDGTDYCGWQKQKNGPTIQGEIERALSSICDTETTLHGAGRTDAGVHASGMTAHFKTSSRVSETSFQNALNSMLPRAIRILDAAHMPDDFHARYSALGKTYCYTCFTGQVMLPCTRLYAHHVPYKLDMETMRSCLDYLVGEHDFSSFEATGSRDKENKHGRGAVRTIYKTDLIQSGELLEMVLTGDGFLRHMVRNLAGTILKLNRNNHGVEELHRIIGYKDRKKAGATAPSCGLSLIKVHYQNDW